MTQNQDQASSLDRITTFDEVAMELKKMASDFIKGSLTIRDILHDQKPDYFLAGGCFSAWYHGSKPKDYDIFIPESPLQDQAMNRILTKLDEYTTHDSSYYGNPAIRMTAAHKTSGVQFIFSNLKTRREIIDGFDMDHCCISYAPREDKLYSSAETFKCIIRKEIKPRKNNTIQPWRLDKMIKKGWTDCSKVPAFL